MLWAAMFVHYFLIYNIDAVGAVVKDHLWAEEFGVFFSAGMLLHACRSLWQTRILALLGVCALFGVALFYSGRPNAMLAVVVPVLSIVIGQRRSILASRATLFGDLSYGIYIYAFPVQQTMVWISAAAWGVWPSMLCSLVATLLLAFLSWHLVEKRALQLKRLVPRPAGRQATRFAPGR